MLHRAFIVGVQPVRTRADVSADEPQRDLPFDESGDTSSLPELRINPCGDVRLRSRIQREHSFERSFWYTNALFESDRAILCAAGAPA